MKSRGDFWIRKEIKKIHQWVGHREDPKECKGVPVSDTFPIWDPLKKDLRV